VIASLERKDASSIRVADSRANDKAMSDSSRQLVTCTQSPGPVRLEFDRRTGPEMDENRVTKKKTSL
jgi:hypothetical protein